MQHAHMSLEVIAESRAAFDQWRAAQLAPAPAPSTPDQARGQQLVEYRCGLCHQVRGTLAGAISAPDLTHIASRRTLAAGTLLNNPGNLSGWIEDPQAVKPELADAESVPFCAGTLGCPRLPGDAAMMPEVTTPKIGVSGFEHEAKLQ